MIVNAVIPAASSQARPSYPQALAAAILGTNRDRRAMRHARIRAFLTDPDGLEAVMPGLSGCEVGRGNDRLRAFRYGHQVAAAAGSAEDLAAALAQLTVDPEELRAALVAQRIRCFRALPPDARFVTRICRADAGAARCRYLAKAGKDWACVKFTRLAEHIDARVQAGAQEARGDNCAGRADAR